jgi:hypothetical protein
VGITSSGANNTVSGVTLGGSGTGWAANVTVGAAVSDDVEIWSYQNIAGGQTSIVVTAAGGTGTQTTSGYAYEFQGNCPFDQKASNANAGTAGTWTTTASPALSQALEFAVYAVAGAAGGLVIAETAAGWTNLAQVAGGANGAQMLSGWQQTAATTALTASGTFAPNSAQSAALATFKATSTTTGGPNLVSVGPQGLGTTWYPVQATISTTTGVLDASTFNLYLGPAGVPITLVGTLFPGGAGTIALAIPSMQPGQFLIGVWQGGKPGDVAAMNVIGLMSALSP